jgi:hypothetical protein
VCQQVWNVGGGRGRCRGEALEGAQHPRVSIGRQWEGDCSSRVRRVAAEWTTVHSNEAAGIWRKAETRPPCIWSLGGLRKPENFQSGSKKKREVR